MQSIWQSICIVIADERQSASAIELSQSLNLAIVEPSASSEFPYQLCFTTEGLMLLANYGTGKSRLFIDFVKGTMGYRRKKGGAYREAIARAVGLKGPQQELKVLDATAGLGRDGFILACLGCNVHLVERSPIMAALLKDALERARQVPELGLIIEKRISLSLGDARSILETLSQSNLDVYPDVVYLDPMFPKASKTALASIDLRIIRDIVGSDSDAEELFQMALKIAQKRVVVKRPIQAPSLSNIKPSYRLLGKSNRYDIYVTIQK